MANNNNSNNSMGSLELLVTCTPVHKTRNGNKVLLYVDVVFGKEIASMDLSYLSFDNNYVSSIAVTMQLTTSSSFFTVLENKVLMPKPDCEKGAQSNYKIRMDELNFKSPDVAALAGSGISILRALKTIRIYLYQSSPQWETFELRNIRAWSQRPTTSVNNSNALSLSMNSASLSSSSSIRSMMTADIELLMDLKRRQNDMTTSSSLGIVGSDSELHRYRRDLSKKKERKRRK